jgi:DNA-binding NarL/FixJ family response regulator
MSTVKPVHAVPPAVAVLGGDADARTEVVQLLAEQGFQLRDGVGPGTLAVLIAAPSEVVRLREIRTLAEADPHTIILVIAPTATPNASLRRALLAGAAGIVLEAEIDHALAATAHALLAGQLAVPSALGRQIAPRPLSHREKQILGLVVEGLTNREIADRLYLAESTVKTHLSSAFRKIDARSRSEAVSRIQDPDSGYGFGILSLGGAPAAAAPAA